MPTRKQHFVMPQAVSLGNRSLRQSPGLEVAVENVRAPGSLLFPCSPVPSRHIPSHAETAYAWGLQECLRAIGSNAVFLLELQEGPPGSGVWGPIHRESGIPHPSGAPVLAHPLQPPQLSCPALLRLQGCGTNPGCHRGLRGIPSAFLFCCFLFKFNYYCILEQSRFTKWCLFWLLSSLIQLNTHIYASVLLQSIKQSPLCYPVGPCGLSIFHMLLCVC